MFLSGLPDKYQQACWSKVVLILSTEQDSVNKVQPPTNPKQCEMWANKVGQA